MSISLIRSIIALEDIETNQKLVWLILAQTCPERGGERIARIGVPKAAARCGMSESTYRRAIAELERIGAIERVGVRKGGRSASGIGYVGAYLVYPVPNTEAALTTTKKPKKPWPKGVIGDRVNPTKRDRVDAASSTVPRDDPASKCQQMLCNSVNRDRVNPAKSDEQPCQKRSLTLSRLVGNQEVLQEEHQEEHQEERQVLAQKAREARSPPKEKTPEELERQKREQLDRIAALADSLTVKSGTQ